MADCRRYRGYILPNPELRGPRDRWLIQFPDFPDLVIKSGNEAMNVGGMINERCFGLILDRIMEMIHDGRQIPVPHEPHPTVMFVEIEIDIDLVRENCGRKN